ALFYARRGAQVGLVGRRREALQAILDSMPGNHLMYVLDVRDRDALHAAAADFQRAGSVDAVIAAAGISVGTLTEEPDDFVVFRAIHETNVLATVATFEPFIAVMKAAGKGRLVGIASVAAARGLPGA